ncbi:MAG: hypothetical protein AABX33_03515 [Nanoarchaeota archaeon]
MKLILYFSILMLLLPIALAEKQIFSGNIMTDTDKKIDGSTFRFKYDEKSDKVFADTPAGGIIIENGQCKPNAIFRVCINRANFSYKNVTTWVYYYEIDAVISKLTGSLSTSSTAKSKTLLQGESTELEVTITNPTDFDITSIVYQQDLTPFIIKEVKKCGLDGNQIVWQGSLKSRYYQQCIATITAQKDGTYTLAGSLSYFNGFETEKNSTESVVVKVLPKQLKSNLLTDQYIEVNHPFYANTSIQNINKEEKIEVYMTIELPKNVALLKDVPGFTQESNILKLNTILEPGSWKNNSLYLQASSEGKGPIKLKLDYLTMGVWDTIENDTIVDIIDPRPIVNFSAEYYEVEPGRDFIVVALINNPGRIRELTDIKATLNAPYNNEIKQSLVKLIPNETYSLISHTIKLPKNMQLEENNNTINLTLNIEYNFYGIIKSLNKSLALSIKPSSANAIDAPAPATQTTNLNVSQISEPADEASAGAIILNKPKTKGLLNKMNLLFGLLILMVLLLLFGIIKFQAKPKVIAASGETKTEPMFKGILIRVLIFALVLILVAAVVFNLRRASEEQPKSGTGISSAGNESVGNATSSTIGQESKFKKPLEILGLIVLIFLVLFILPAVIIKMKRRKKSGGTTMQSAEQEALKELQEKTFK